MELTCGRFTSRKPTPERGSSWSGWRARTRAGAYQRIAGELNKLCLSV